MSAFTKKKKIAVSAIVLASILTIIAIITTAVCLSGKHAPVVDTPIIDTPIVTKPDTPNPDKEDPKPSVQLAGLPVVGTVELGYVADTHVYSPTLALWQTHQGVDFAAERGTPVVAILDGIVDKVVADPYHGTTVVIKHSDDRVSIYKSLESKVTVKAGDTVAKGAKIGTVGDSMLSEIKQGPHLHLEMTLNGELVNPADFIADLGNK